VNSKRKGDEFPLFLTYKNQASKDSKKISYFFKDFFSKSFKDSPTEIDFNYFDFMPQPSSASSNTFNTYPIISSELVLEHLSKLNNCSIPGPDNVPEIILKNCANLLCVPLALMFNKSLANSVVPDLWKEAFIRPHFKNGQKNAVTSYRNIARLSVIPKLFEKIIVDLVYPEIYHLISPCQHGFVKKRSTVTNMVELTSKIINNMEKGSETTVVYTDMSKAFDLLPHKIILFKLQKLSLPEWFIKWVESYLLGRSYRVIFRNEI
jgi:hypothetical protein